LEDSPANGTSATIVELMSGSVLDRPRAAVDRQIGYLVRLVNQTLEERSSWPRGMQDRSS
jgi:hypothetical protein